MPDTIKINFIGTGCLIVKGIIEDDLWNKLQITSNKLGSSFETAVFDVEFFRLLNEKQYSTFKDLGTTLVNGLLYDGKSHIEIRLNSKRKRIIKLKDIVEDNLLFSLFNKEFIEITTDKTLRELVLIETEIGLISSYKIVTEHFDFDLLKFSIYSLKTNYTGYTVVGDLTYNNEILSSIRSDSVVSGSAAKIYNK